MIKMENVIIFNRVLFLGAFSIAIRGYLQSIEEDSYWIDDTHRFFDHVIITKFKAFFGA